jgi:hypothetical protein
LSSLKDNQIDRLSRLPQIQERCFFALVYVFNMYATTCLMDSFLMFLNISAGAAQKIFQAGIVLEHEYESYVERGR